MSWIDADQWVSLLPEPQTAAMPLYVPALGEVLVSPGAVLRGVRTAKAVAGRAATAGSVTLGSRVGSICGLAYLHYGCRSPYSWFIQSAMGVN